MYDTLAPDEEEVAENSNTYLYTRYQHWVHKIEMSAVLTSTAGKSMSSVGTPMVHAVSSWKFHMVTNPVEKMTAQAATSSR